MKRTELPFSLRMLQGAIGKRFVIKHYKYGIIKSRFPDMSRIVTSEGQRKCRDLFKDAVAYARLVMQDPALVKIWRQKTGRTRRLFNAIIKDYMLMEGLARTQQTVIANRIIRNSFKGPAYRDEKIWPATTLTNAWGLKGKRSEKKANRTPLRLLHYGCLAYFCRLNEGKYFTFIYRATDRSPGKVLPFN